MKHNSERGVIFLVVLVSVIILAGAVASLLAVEHARSEFARSQGERERAFTIAESGVDTVAALLSADAWPAGSALAWAADGIDNDGDGLVDEGDESLTATSETWKTDAVDNDADGLVDEQDEDVVRVSCSATIGRSTTTVTAWFLSTAATLQIPPAAVYLNDPAATTHFPGKNDLIDGNDVNVDGTPGPAPPAWGIGINGDAEQVINQLSDDQRANVRGQGGAPSITSYAQSDPDYVQNFVDLLGPRATVVFNGPSSTYAGTLGNWSTGEFVIALSHGELRIGGGSGAGVLLVEGDLVVSGDWEYVGYVFVTGRVRLQGGGSDKRIRGALFVGGDFEKDAPDLYVKSGEILFSSEALAAVRNAFAGYQFAAMTEP